MRKTLLALGALALTGSALCVLAATPAPLDKVAPAADLVQEAQAKITALEAALASKDTYLEMKKSVASDAGVLAILAQALAEHSDKTAWKASSADVRNAALKLAEAASFDDAKAALDSVKSAADGKAADGKPEHEWNKLAKLGTVMSEVNKRHAKLRNAGKKLPADVEEAARHASVLAVLGLVAHSDTHEVTKDADKAEWEKLCLEMSESASEISAALKAKDLGKTKTAVDRNKKSCADCHAKYRKT